MHINCVVGTDKVVSLYKGHDSKIHMKATISRYVLVTDLSYFDYFTYSEILIRPLN